MLDLFDYLWNEFCYRKLAENAKKNSLCVTRTLKPTPTGFQHSASQSDNAAFHCDDEDNTKEEEVYQDLCAIQSSIARNSNQVFIDFCR